MSLLTSLPPVDRILLAALERDKTISALKTGMFLPANLAANLPLVTVTPLGGSSTPLDLNGAFDVDVYTATRGGTLGSRAVCDMVEACLTRQRIWATVDSKRYFIDTTTGPLFREVPWDDETVRHCVATIQVTARRV